MLWEDIVIGGSQLSFLVGLIPTILSRDEKPPLSTSLTTAFFMSVLVAPSVSLGLYSSVVVTTALAIGWWIIAWQVWRKRRR